MNKVSMDATKSITTPTAARGDPCESVGEDSHKMVGDETGMKLASESNRWQIDYCEERKTLMELKSNCFGVYNALALMQIHFLMWW